jgi:hypothetical protein
VVQIERPAPRVEGLPTNGEAELRFASGPGICHLIAGTLTPAQAVKEDVVTIREGQRETSRAIHGTLPERYPKG